MLVCIRNANSFALVSGFESEKDLNGKPSALLTCSYSDQAVLNGEERKLQLVRLTSCFSHLPH